MWLCTFKARKCNEIEIGQCLGHELSPRSQMFIIIIFITITQQPEQDRWAENQPTAGLSSLNEYEYENEYENGMRRSRTELKILFF